MPRVSFDFYPTPSPFTQWLVKACAERGFPIHGTVLESCAGANDIVDALGVDPITRIITNDLDPKWNTDYNFDASTPELRQALGHVDWEVSNYPFNGALPILQAAMERATSVAVYHRCTLKEPLKGAGLGRSFFREHSPTMTLWCPRWAHQRSRKTNKWSTDSATCVWSVWVPGQRPIGDVWPPDSLFEEIGPMFTAQYRARVDALMGWL